MSDTEQLFILAGVWTIGAAVVAYFIPKWPAKIIAFALLVGIPFWELPFGYYKFLNLCAHEGGWRVFEKIAPQQSVCAIYPLDSATKQFIDAGFTIVEAKDKGGNTWRYTRDEINDKPKAAGSATVSEYCVVQDFIEGLPWRIQRNEHVVVRLSDKHIVGRFSDFVWYGTWWQQKAIPMLGRGGECRHGDAIPAIAYTLRAGSQ